MGLTIGAPTADAYHPSPDTDAASHDSVPPPPPADPATPITSSPSILRRASLRASFLWAQTVQPEEPKPPPIEINRLDVPREENHPYGSYRVSKKIGYGGFSVVYTGHKASDVKEKVAIKEIDISQLSPKRIEDLHIEMNILSQLSHENIVRLYAVYMQNEKIYMVMEYLRGGELLQAICKREFYSEGDARQLLKQIASALHYIHQREVIHRDVKPENLILADLSFNSHVKLVDFGFATTSQQVRDHPSSYLCGTRGYIAPEVLKDRKYSNKSDIWSLGVVFYIMISGLMPFRTTKDGEVDVLSCNFSFPAVRFSAVSKMAKDLISKMLTLDPDKRLTAKQVLEHPWTKLRTSNDHPDVDITGNLHSIRMHRLSQKGRAGSSSIFWCLPALCSSSTSITSTGFISPVVEREMETDGKRSLEDNFRDHLSNPNYVRDQDFAQSFQLQPSVKEDT